MRSEETWLRCDRAPHSCNSRVLIPETMDEGSEAPDAGWHKAVDPKGQAADLCPSCWNELEVWWAP